MPDEPLDPPNTRWRLRLLGDLRATRGARDIRRFLTRKTALLFAFLAYDPRHAHSRDALIELLWPEASRRAGSSSLSTALTSLRRELEPPDVPAGSVLVTDRATVGLREGAVESDVALFDAALAAAGSAETGEERRRRLAAAVEQYGGELLPGYHDDWVLQERGWLAERYFRALEELIGLLESEGRSEEARDYARRRVRVDLPREETHPASDPGHGSGATLHNAPPRLAPLIGREGEIAAVHALLAGRRLVTLTGAGGCGKTRLALEVAATLLTAFPDGAWFVDLAPFSDPALVAPAVAAVLGVPERPDGSPLQSLAADLAGRHSLLLLDNCEHLVEACARLVAFLLPACPGLHILATSREPLSLPGETRSSVTGLPPGDAAHLFAQRAAAVHPDFRLTDATVPAVEEICARLDGMPLAIELAAARIGALSLDQIRRGLDDRFQLLKGDSPQAAPRQRTLKALIDWSYHRLSGPEQALLRRLSVFADGWTLEAAEAVGDGDVLNLLAALIDRSLVQQDERDGEAHYRLLESVREYARERLQELGEEERVTQAHRDFTLP